MQASWFGENVFDRTLQEYEFTPAAKRQISRLACSEHFSGQEAKKIYAFLKGGIRLRSFQDYLKRYIYLKAEMDRPFLSIPEEEYQEMIIEAFRENSTPFSWEPSTKRASQTVKGWLNADGVRRSTVFLLGFGLRMSEKDVHEFLQKVLREATFDFYRPDEVIFWYCFRYRKSYARARQLLRWYEDPEHTVLKPDPADGAAVSAEAGVPLTAVSGQEEVVDASENGKSSAAAPVSEISGPESTAATSNCRAVLHAAPAQERGSKPSYRNAPRIRTEKELLRYLENLKKTGRPDIRRMTVYRTFKALVQEAREKIAKLYESDIDKSRRREVWRPEQITFADIERVLCSGIPVNAQKNLQRMTASTLNRQFESKRVSRQRLDVVWNGRDEANRFDLLSLLFFITGQQDFPNPESRMEAFLERANPMLKSCGMLPVYPANPYEAFLLLCLLSFDPMDTYAEIWERSFTEHPDEERDGYTE